MKTKALKNLPIETLQAMLATTEKFGGADSIAAKILRRTIQSKQNTSKKTKGGAK